MLNFLPKTKFETKFMQRKYFDGNRKENMT